MDPGYTGARPRFQVYHGSTDTILHSENYEETVKEWTGVFGYDYTTPESSQDNYPEAGYTTQTWGVSDANPLGTVQGIYAEGVGHTVPINGTTSNKLRSRKFQRYTTVFCKLMSNSLRYLAAMFTELCSGRIATMASPLTSSAPSSGCKTLFQYMLSHTPAQEHTFI